ncbi:stalk domain-containing protein [Paenibacillus sp. YYML68]|uniref:stalk domain-containing protein n=1 Tax=Paenibacillus sp. YYML68 TaxID=2909250 RepID=UPI00248F8478|nr:stalk domain-containing protein [Paenibacillus sp. YYML68]
MKVPRLLTMVLSLTLFGTAGAVASSIWGEFEGYSKVRLVVNDAEQSFGSSEVPAFLVKGSAVLPVRTLSDSLQAIVKWDSASHTVAVHKPNVHMFVAKTVEDDYDIKQPFGVVKQGKQLGFSVLAQVDSLNTSIRSFQISIVSPSGKQVAAKEEVVDSDKSSFWYAWPFNVTFTEKGTYKVRFAVKTTADGKYVTISEKSIVSE